MLRRSLLFVSGILASLWFTFSTSIAADTIVGVPTVIAGNLIEIDGARYYLNGLALPTMQDDCVIGDEGCAAHSKQALTALIGKQTISCVRQEQSHGSLPTIACELMGKDLSTLAAAKGIALPFAENDLTQSVAEKAQTTQVGLLSSPFVKSMLQDLQSGAIAPRDCEIKGNVSRETGNKIYHVPGAAHYKRTLISPARGERWFCTEENALAAGFRKAAN